MHNVPIPSWPLSSYYVIIVFNAKINNAIKSVGLGWALMGLPELHSRNRKPTFQRTRQFLKLLFYRGGKLRFTHPLLNVFSGKVCLVKSIRRCWIAFYSWL